MARVAVTNRATVPAVQNLITYSEQFDNAAWTNSGTTETADTIANPVDGATTADTLTASAGGTYHYIGRSVVTELTVGAQYTLSAFVKRNNNDWIYLMFPHNSATANFAYFNTATGAFGTKSANISGTSVTALSSGWYRITATATYIAGGTIGAGVGIANANDGASFSAAGTEAVEIFGAQVTQANWEGAYVQTAGSQVNTGNIRNKPQVQQNLLLRSEQFDHGNWATTAGVTVTADAVTAPDGTLTADQLDFAVTTSYHYQTVTIPTGGKGQVFTFSVWLYSPTKATIVIDLRGQPGNIGVYRVVNLPPGWTRYSVKNNTLYTDTSILVGFDNRTGGTQGDGLAGTVYAWGAQLVVGTQEGPYVQTVSAAVNNGNIRNKAGQNLVTYSEQFDNGAWTKVALTISANTADITDPLGNNFADKVIETTDTSQHRFPQSTGLSDKTGLTYIFSCYAKDGTRRYLNITAATAATYEVTFDLQNGTVTSESGATGIITGFGNGWYRCSIVFTIADAGALTVQLALNNSGGVLASYAGDTANYLYMWGAQLAKANYEVPYLNTVVSRVTLQEFRTKL